MLKHTDALLRQLIPPTDGVGLHLHSPTRGRLLETALTLYLLQRRRPGHDLAWQQRLETFLLQHVEASDVFSGFVARSVLARSERASSLAESASSLSALLGSLEYARKRKHALLATILEEIGAVPPRSAPSDTHHLADEATHLFSRLYLAAMNLLHRRGALACEETRRDERFLLDHQGESGGWEQQSLITILALLTLDPASVPFDRGLRFLKSVTRKDGGVAPTDNLHLWTTALGALALQRNHAPAESGLRRIAEYIVARQLSNGGWTFSEGMTQADTDTSSQCVQVLIELDAERYAEPIARAHEYFLDLRRPDGGYPTYERAGDSEVTMTANIALVQALCSDSQPYLRAPIQEALAFIRSRQKPNGTFERSWSLCETYSMFRVNLALDACRDVDGDPAASAETQQRALAYLLEHQHEDGGWGQTSEQAADALSTAYGLLSFRTLQRHVPQERIEKAEDYLISQQHPETGEFISIPDATGPRPFVIDIPLLSTVFAAWALAPVDPGG
jgi:prenyltransferase beta subunit